jgi:hypothetical protein
MHAQPPADVPAHGGIDRLARSRADIARWLAKDADARVDPGSSPASRSTNYADTPVNLAALALGALTEALRQHPALGSARLAAATAQALLAPLARTHPWALVGVAAGTGAALMAGRRWRWLLRPAVLLSVAPCATSIFRAMASS